MKSLPKKFAEISRVKLAHLPTPLVPLERLTQDLGAAQIWVKRDDMTGLATGGNKTRKLEFLIADALARQADVVITAGGPQSNHCRQTAAAAARSGLAYHLVLGGDPQPRLGNLLLDELLGAEIHWTPKTERNQKMEAVAAELRSAGRRPYVIPVGGSNGVGALGYVAAMFELAEQLAAQSLTIDRIVFATSSGGTQAGMALGARLAGYQGKIQPMSIDQTPADHFDAEVASIAAEAAELLEVDGMLPEGQTEICYDYLGEGYGVVGELERATIRLAARTEGLLVGPVYTGRALGGLIDMVRSSKIDASEKVLFWHTGDEAALHAYSDELCR